MLRVRKCNCFYSQHLTSENVLFTKKKFMCSHIADAGARAEAYLIASPVALSQLAEAVEKVLSSHLGCAAVELSMPSGKDFMLQAIAS